MARFSSPVSIAYLENSTPLPQDIVIHGSSEWWKYGSSSTPVLEELLADLVAIDPNNTERAKQLRLVTRPTCSGIYCVGDAESMQLPELQKLLETRLVAAEMPFPDQLSCNLHLDAALDAQFCVASLCGSVQYKRKVARFGIFEDATYSQILYLSKFKTMADIQWLISPALKLFHGKGRSGLHRELDLIQHALRKCHKKLISIYQGGCEITGIQHTIEAIVDTAIWYHDRAIDIITEIIQMINTCFEFWFALEGPVWEDYYDPIQKGFCTLGILDNSLVKSEIIPPPKRKIIRQWSHKQMGCCKTNSNLGVPIIELPTPKFTNQPLHTIEEVSATPSPIIEIKLELATPSTFYTSPAEHIEYSKGEHSSSTETASFTDMFSGSVRSKRAWARESLESIKGSLRRRARVSTPRDDKRVWGKRSFNSLKDYNPRVSTLAPFEERVGTFSQCWGTPKSRSRRSIFKTFSFEEDRICR